MTGDFIAQIEDCIPLGASNNDGMYVYDGTGNIIQTPEGDSIIWDVYGKVKQVIDLDSENDIKSAFEYDPYGNRAMKTHFNTVDSSEHKTIYIRDASGNILATYKMDSSEMTWDEQHIYGSSRIGIISKGVVLSDTSNLPQLPYTEKTGQFNRGKKYYELSNHLGNVLAVINDRKESIDTDGDDLANHYESSIVSANDYYPFGLQMPERSYSSPLYRYGFNGKEKDENGEWGDQTHYDYGFRIYNPALGRFLSIDPLTKNYPELTPYQFASNTPILGIDVDGLEVLSVNSADYTKQLREMNLDGMTKEQVMNEITKIRTKFGEKYGGYFSEASRKHATEYYESQGEVVTIENTYGPLTIYGYSNAVDGDVTRELIYQSEAGDTEVSKPAPAKGMKNQLTGLQYGLAAAVQKYSGFGKLTRALYNHMEGVDPWEGEKGSTSELITGGITDLATMGTGPLSASVNMGLNLAQEVEENTDANITKEVGVGREIFDIGFTFLTEAKKPVIWVETISNTIQLGLQIKNYNSDSESDTNSESSNSSSSTSNEESDEKKE